ncbi:nicotinamidase [Helicobacter sp. 13S00401-1]|nr:nicotinamidase [Helicobacter sp. 13S00401-1]
MLNDFVTGSLKCERAQDIIQNIVKLLDSAREHKIPVIFSNDAHIKGIDHELALWGDHGIAGTKGAEVIPELKVSKIDFIVPKRRYSGFFATHLDILLRELDVDTLVITGLHTNICVRHTTADAFCLGYKIIVPSDGTNAFTEKDYEEGLEYLKMVYGAKIVTVEELVKFFDR